MATCDAYECKIFTPWRQTQENCKTGALHEGSGLFFKIDDSAQISEFAWFGTPSEYTNCRTIYLNTEEDPDLQTLDTDVIVPPGGVACLSGIVRFQNMGASITFSLESYDELSPAWDTSGATSDITLFAVPGRMISISGCPDAYYGIEAENECQGPLKTGCDINPHEAQGAAHRDNGGYFGEPGPLDTDLAFTICINLNGPTQQVLYSGDFGEGYMEQLQYVNDDHHQPGEPFYCPFTAGDHNTNPGVCDHAGHKIKISVNVGSGTTTGDHPAVILKGMTSGHADCIPNPNYVNPTDDQS